MVGWDHVASRWCRFYDRHDPWDQWAEQTLIALFIHRDVLPAEDAWRLILRLLEIAPNEKVIGNIGAGLIEDLLSRDPELVGKLIEAEAAGNPRLRRALDHVWQFRTPTTFSSASNVSLSPRSNAI